MHPKPHVFSVGLALNLFIEFGPIVLFFIVFNFFNFILATLTLVIVVAITFCISFFIEKRIAVFPLFASGTIIVFGLATVVFDDPVYIIFKDTLFWGLSGLLLLGYHLRGILILKKLFIHIFDISDDAWRTITLRWAMFALLIAISNQIALMYFNPTQWVYYKMLTLIAFVPFMAWQFITSRKYKNPTANPWGMRV